MSYSINQDLDELKKYFDPKDKNFVCTIKNGSGNTYIINPSLAWSSYGNNVNYCRFYSITNKTVTLPEDDGWKLTKVRKSKKCASKLNK